jgi:cytochrome P450
MLTELVPLSRHEAYAAGIPHALFAELRRTRPVFWHEAPDEPPFWAVTRYRDIVEISLDNDIFSSAQGVFVEDIASGRGIPGSLLTADPPRHTEMRTQFNKWFSPGAINQLSDWLRDEARTIMAAAARREQSEFVYDMAARLPLLTICQFLGVPEDDREQMLEWADAVVGSKGDVALGEALTQLGAYGLRLADPSSGHQSSPLVTQMRDSLAQRDAEFAGQFAQLLVAGNETTRTLLSNIILELAAAPGLFAELKASPDLLPTAIEEFLRWSSPIYYMRRTARRDYVLQDQQIRAGDPVIMYYASANRDEEVFEEPDRLDIRRRPNRHLSFGVGRHNCLGAQLARLEARIFLEEMLAQFDRVEVLGQPQRLTSNVVNGWSRIDVRLT